MTTREANPVREPSRVEQELIDNLGFSSLAELQEWMNSPKDPALIDEIMSPDPEEEAYAYLYPNGDPDDDPEADLDPDSLPM